jgi:hypothetical protein
MNGLENVKTISDDYGRGNIINLVFFSLMVNY